MTGGKKRAIILNSAERNINLPTPERRAKGSISVHNNIARADEPLRIDKLYRSGVIDEMQHLYGVQIITLWTTASRPLLKTMRYERIGSSLMPGDFINISRMSAEDQLRKTLGFLCKRDYTLIGKICFEEQGAIEAGRSLKLPVNSITHYVCGAFDKLGEALARMRDFKKKLEEPEPAPEDNDGRDIWR